MGIEQMNFLRRAWVGEERLWKVWWLLGMPLNVVTAVFSVWAEEPSVAATPASALVTLVGFFVIAAAYFAWCNMAWSCAKNVDNKAWTNIVKVFIVLGLLRFALELIKGFQQS